MVISPGARTFTSTTLAVVVVALLTRSAEAQGGTSPQRHVTIPFLANASKPADLEYEAAECDIDADGSRMTCAFQQLFLTTSSLVDDTCLVTTNRYDRVFRLDSPSHWISTEGPEGACGLLDVATLTDGGGVKWTMELKKEVTLKEGSVACLTMKVPTEVFSWQNIRRHLPCRNIQPGALTP
jgi:hypothetical protein